MYKGIAAGASVLALMAGFIAGIWPMTIEVLGMAVYSRPAPIMLWNLLVEGRPGEIAGDTFGGVAASTWDGLFYEALIRTLIAASLFVSGAGGLISLAVTAIVGDRR